MHVRSSKTISVNNYRTLNRVKTEVCGRSSRESREAMFLEFDVVARHNTHPWVTLFFFLVLNRPAILGDVMLPFFFFWEQQGHCFSSWPAGPSLLRASMYILPKYQWLADIRLSPPRRGSQPATHSLSVGKHAINHNPALSPLCMSSQFPRKRIRAFN